MKLQKIRQDIVQNLTNDLVFINQKIKTFDEPVKTYEDLPLNNNDDGDIRVVLNENCVYLWSNEQNKWTKFNGESVYSKILFFTISEIGKTIFNTGVRFDNTGELQTTSEKVNVYLNGVLVDETNYTSKNVNDELVITWTNTNLQLELDDQIAIQYYHTNGGITSSGGGNVDLSNYYTKEEIHTKIQDIELTPGPKGIKVMHLSMMTLHQNN